MVGVPGSSSFGVPGSSKMGYLVIKLVTYLASFMNQLQVHNQSLGIMELARLIDHQ